MRIESLLQRCLEGRDLEEKAVTVLLQTRGDSLKKTLQAADRLRRETVGDDVSYVVNRNVNFTNVCVKRCGFCAFSRKFRSDEGYLLPIGEIVRRAREARQLGATEICVQAGLLPDMPGRLYIDTCEAIKEAEPDLHIHAFSPEEVLYGSRRSGSEILSYLKDLKNAGIGSLPGTSAEILDQSIRDRISPGRISVRNWIRVIRAAHELGIPTTSTIMYVHVEQPRHVARHLLLLRDLQRETGGFTEFVPLSFVASEAPMYREGALADLRSGAEEDEILRIHAVARLVLNRDIPNIQFSWVKEGLALAAQCLKAGANDMGGTLINESISTSAGSQHGQLVRPLDLRRTIRAAGRIPLQRSTLYEILRRFPTRAADQASALDRVSEEEAQRFGSYRRLTQTEKFRFVPEREGVSDTHRGHNAVDVSRPGQVNYRRSSDDCDTG